MSVNDKEGTNNHIHGRNQIECRVGTFGAEWLMGKTSEKGKANRNLEVRTQ